jgi:hypothetical protein
MIARVGRNHRCWHAGMLADAGMRAAQLCVWTAASLRHSRPARAYDAAGIWQPFWTGFSNCKVIPDAACGMVILSTSMIWFSS